MNQAIASVVIIVVLLAMLPMAVKWITQRRLAGMGPELASSKLISVLAVGPQQRVVTVEVGPAGARTWLVLGVTPQSITTLHALAPGNALSQGERLPATRSTAAAGSND